MNLRVNENKGMQAVSALSLGASQTHSGISASPLEVHKIAVTNEGFVRWSHADCGAKTCITVLIVSSGYVATISDTPASAPAVTTTLRG